MTTRKTIDPKSLDKLKKVWAMRGSSHEGERRNAESRAAHILRPFGYGIEDIPEILRHADQETAERGRGGHESRPTEDWSNPAFRAAYKEKVRKERERQAKREETIRRYGGEDKVMAWTRRETLIRAAVAKWSTFLPPPNEQHTQYLDGRGSVLVEGHSARVIRAISEAYRLPSTITEAEAEYGIWRQRHDDLALVRLESPFEDYQLDLPVQLRWQLVTNLLETELRAASVSEAFIRQKHYLSLQYFRPEIDDAVLKDLEGLARLEQMQRVQNGHLANPPPISKTTAGERRAEVEKLLSNLDTMLLSDREIARRVGVSPQTVGNIRRRTTHHAST